MGSPPMNTMRARLESDKDGLVAVIGAGRPDEIRLRLRDYDGAAPFVGRDVVVGIRPECIAEGPAVSSRPGFATMSAPVELVEPTGAETMVSLRLGGEPAMARISPDIRPAPGALAAFALDTRRICLFEPETERLIA